MKTSMIIAVIYTTLKAVVKLRGPRIMNAYVT